MKPKETLTDRAPTSIFQKLLGSAWNNLPKPVQDMHSAEGNLQLSGRATVERGNGILARMVAAIFRFPSAGLNVPVDVCIAKSADTELWRRTFAGRAFSSVVSCGSGQSDQLINERFGPITIGLALAVDDGKLRFIVRNWKLWIFPLPRAWAPSGESYEYSNHDRFGFSIEIRHASTGLIVKYSGWLMPNQ